VNFHYAGSRISVVPAFSPDAARHHPAQLTEVRVAAAERVAAAPMPTADEEIWRYSRIAELDLARYRPSRPATQVDGPPSVLGSPTLDDVAIAAPDVFADLNTAFVSPTVVRVPAGTVVERPVVVTHTLAHDADAVFPRLVVDAGTDSEVTVIERFLSPPGITGLVSPVLLLRAGAAARVRYLALNELGESVWSIGHQLATGDRDSTTQITTVALGGDYARTRTEARISGPGASVRQIALYLASGTQMHDFRTIQDHDAPRSTSDLLFKGAVGGTARSVYTGLIRIRPHARGTNAFQTNRTLTLSEGAWAESVPNLDIETNDVRCSHASTVGPIDEDQRFYLESRGIRPDVAQRLVVLGFFDEVLDQLPGGELVGGVRSRLASKVHEVLA
jgi:Fe-S cluster assembly protein SufD